MTKTFAELGLPKSILSALDKMNFTTPTPIQIQAIPIALEGRDVLGSAQTGTGKTAAFGIPMLTHLIKNNKSIGVVLTPTRELAMQVLDAIHQMQDRSSPIATALIIGGDSMQKQFKQLQRNPRIIVGTPGRINDHLTRKSLKLRNADFLVLDETDRMLDMGFGVQVEKIVECMANKRQTLMFSATMPKNIVKMADRYQNNPQRITVGSTTKPLDNIKQEIVETTTIKKYESLTTVLNEKTGSIIMFVKTKHGADRMARKLNRDGYKVEALHGDMKQSRRARVIQSFRDKKCRILVATDVAARGLDIPHIGYVINYDLPQCPEDYIHRIGRTARAGAEGTAICFLTQADGKKWNDIQFLINPNGMKAPSSFRNKNNSKKKKNSSKRWKDKKGNGGFQKGFNQGEKKDGEKSKGFKVKKKKPFKFKQHNKNVNKQKQRAA